MDAIKICPPDSRDKIVVVFLGSGDLRTSLERAANTEPRIQTVFVGFKNQGELSRYYHIADILVLPSRQEETWGLVVNEALLHGVPCVVSDQVGCAPDLIEPGETGEIFKSGSVRDLNRALIRCLTLSDTPEVRRKCREKVSGYSVQQAAEGVAKAYYSAESR